MNDGSQFIDIILFAMVAVFIGLRLRSVLGRRTGNERPPGPLLGRGRPAPPDPAADNVVDMNRRRQAPLELPEGTPPDSPLARGLALVSAADPTFSPEGFTQGARSAFEMIVRAFAQGDETALRPLLSNEVYEQFAQAIRTRNAQGLTSGNEVMAIVSAEIVEARMENRTARVSVRFVSRQILLTKDAEGRVIDGDPSHQVQLTDLWSFARDTRARDPNWLLVATDSHEE